MDRKESIELLFRAHYSSLYSLAHSMLGDEEDAHDAVQEVFSTLLHSENSIDYGKGFLMRCVRNRCINIIKRLPLRERVERHISPEAVSVWPDSENPEEMIEIMRHIILHELPDKCGEIMRLRYEEGKNYSEIAEMFGISKAGVYKHLRNGIEYLKRNLKRIRN